LESRTIEVLLIDEIEVSVDGEARFSGVLTESDVFEYIVVVDAGAHESVEKFVLLFLHYVEVGVEVVGKGLLVGTTSDTELVVFFGGSGGGLGVLVGEVDEFVVVKVSDGVGRGVASDLIDDVENNVLAFYGSFKCGFGENSLIMISFGSQYLEGLGVVIVENSCAEEMFFVHCVQDYLGFIKEGHKFQCSLFETWKLGIVGKVVQHHAISMEAIESGSQFIASNELGQVLKQFLLDFLLTVRSEEQSVRNGSSERIGTLWESLPT
jgi:hypothetical protein